MIDNDIRFYDFDFNLLYILPPFADKNGYSAINTSMQFNGAGTLEITFRSEDLRQIITNNRDNIFVVWRDFQGYITGYMFTETTYKLFGKHLNGLLTRTVIPTVSEYTGKAGYILNARVLPKISWLAVEPGIADKGTKITYSTDKYTKADDTIQEINKMSKAGYMIKANIVNKTLTYYFLDRTENNLMLSVGNLNIYEPQTTYKNTDLAYSGWYEAEIEGVKTWLYITNDNTKTGIYNINVVLSATTTEEAQKELDKHVSDLEISTKTKNLVYGVDYKVGDIVRIQTNGITAQRYVSGVNMWNEQTYGEEPILSEL